MNSRHRNHKRMCHGCGVHWARFQYRGRVRWDRRHDVCFRCWQSLMDRYRPVRSRFATPQNFPPLPPPMREAA